MSTDLGIDLREHAWATDHGIYHVSATTDTGALDLAALYRAIARRSAVDRHHARGVLRRYPSPAAIIRDLAGSCRGARVDLTKRPLTDLEQRLVDVGADRGFMLTHLVKYYCELDHPGSNVTIYLDRQRTPRNVIAVMIHPETDVTPLHALLGLTVKPDLRHGSNMRRFPARVHTGAKPITYGRLVECADISAFNRLLQTLTTDSADRSRRGHPEDAPPSADPGSS